MLTTSVCMLGLVSRTTKAAEPIPIYLFAGQSNMVGTATRTQELPMVAPELDVPPKTVQFWGPTTDLARRWEVIEPPTEIAQAESHSGFGPEISAAPLLANLHPNQTVAIVKFAWNGTSLYSDWNPDRTWSLYRGLVDEMHYARAKIEADSKMPTRVAGLFWMQGESDANTKAHALAYGRNLAALIWNLRREFRAPSLPVVIGQISDVRRLYPYTLPYSGIVRSQQYNVAAADPHIFLVRTDDLEHASYSPVHLSTRGTVDLGRRMVLRNVGL